MENFYQILQNLVGMEGEILIIFLVSRVASVHILFLERLEVGIRCIILADVAQCLVRGSVVLHQPHVGILCLVEYRLET